jgi:hypothetical protein
MTSRPERPSLPAQKVGAPNSSPSAGQIVGERRAREIKVNKEDPRRSYFKLLLTLSIAVPNNAEKIIDELQINPDELPEATRRLMTEAIDTSLNTLKRIETKLEKLRNVLSGGDDR